MEDKIKELRDFLGEMELKLKKISEELNRKPREFWLEYDDKSTMFWVNGMNPIASSYEIIHVREVIDE